MVKSIFDIEVRIDINKEFKKMVNYLHYKGGTTISEVSSNLVSSFIDAINSYAFKKWPYRGTTINCEEYLESIGFPYLYFKNPSFIDEKNFLYYIEFIYNIYYFSCDNYYIEIVDENVKAIIENMDIIVEKLNYKFTKNGDRYLLVKRDPNVDSILTIVDEDIGNLLLEYNDIRIKEDLKRKSEILKYIDKYIEKQKSIFSRIDSDTYNSIGYIMNNFGINHKINDKYLTITNKELLEWYDKCFMLDIHLIRTIKIKEINQERKKLDS